MILKKKAKERDDYTCQDCGFVGKVQTIRGNKLIWVSCDDLVQADHIIPKAIQKAKTVEEFQTLCKDCHKKKTKLDLKVIKEWRKNNGFVR